MIGIDTNVLVRYITQDDPQQSSLASTIIEQSCTRDDPGFINHIVLCELVWVLKRCYNASKEESLAVVEQILRTAQLQVFQPQVVWQALKETRAGGVDFADYLNVRINKNMGCLETVTFDRALAQNEGVRLLGE
jgi:predicted nucleic-acid-binding protein